jgi:hypothetical protein
MPVISLTRNAWRRRAGAEWRATKAAKRMFVSMKRYRPSQAVGCYHIVPKHMAGQDEFCVLMPRTD